MARTEGAPREGASLEGMPTAAQRLETMVAITRVTIRPAGTDRDLWEKNKADQLHHLAVGVLNSPTPQIIAAGNFLARLHDIQTQQAREIMSSIVGVFRQVGTEDGLRDTVREKREGKIKQLFQNVPISPLSSTSPSSAMVRRDRP
jgi:hypothetical protein